MTILQREDRGAIAPSDDERARQLNALVGRDAGGAACSV